MENNTGLTSIRKNNRDVFGRSSRRFPVFIVGAVLIGALVVATLFITKDQNKKLDAYDQEIALINTRIAKLQEEQNKIQDDKIVIGELMNQLPTANTVSSDSILTEIRDYIEMSGLNATIASFSAVENADIPDTIVGLTEEIHAYECAISVTSSEGLQKITDLLNYMYTGDTFYYLYSYSVETSGDTYQASITLYTFVSEYAK